jgi:hypothetical protein
MHTSSSVYDSLESIEDITSDTLEKLKRLHIGSVSQLAVQSPRELATGMNDNGSDDTSFDIESASKLIASARKYSTRHRFLSKEFSTADDLLPKGISSLDMPLAQTNSTHF